MPFRLNFPGLDGSDNNLQLANGEMLFVLGANGTGKSSLMHLFANRNQGNSRKIAAHRQTWMNTDSLDLTPAKKMQIEHNLQNEDRSQESRYRDPYAQQRASMTIYEIIDAENVRARSIAAAFDAGDMESAQTAARVESPITVINELLCQSNMNIQISLHQNERVMASKSGGQEYSAAQLSDGERNALLIAGNILTAPSDTLLIIDEPERHLHRSIISPLLSQLFERRPDCGFVVSTHDHDLPLDAPGARTLLLRSCNFTKNTVRGWEADELPPDSPIDDILKRDLIGARRKVLFVEGTERSLDKPLYSLIFPMVSVIAKGTCRDVETSVIGSRAGEGFHWLRVFGIADGDGYDAATVEQKRGVGVYVIPYYSIEAIYFHPRIVERIAARQAAVTGSDAATMSQTALALGVRAVAGHTERLSIKVTKKRVRKFIEAQIPNDDQLLAGHNLLLTNDATTIHAEREQQLKSAVEANDWDSILLRCPVRESPALGAISAELGFKNIGCYEKAVRHLLATDDSVLNFVRNLFEGLFEEINK